MKELDAAPPAEVLAWAFENIRPVAVACSFQLGGLCLVHMARRLVRPVPVIFLQTGFHFPETIEFRDRVVADWDLQLIETEPTLGAERQAREVHPELYRADPDLCCRLNKVLPLQDALERLDGWITGVRRDQSPARAGTPVVSRQKLHSGREIWKVSPLARWTKDQVEAYADHHDVPRHPLYDRGYLSIGCAPCTSPVRPGEDERSGRWSGSTKTECGIHTA